MQTNRIGGMLLGFALAATLAVSARPARAWIYTEDGACVAEAMLAVDQALTVATDASGDIIAGGRIGVSPYVSDGLVVKFSGRLGAPTTLWGARFTTTSYPIPFSWVNQVAVDTQGNVVLAGERGGAEANWKYHLQFQVAKLDGATGAILWEQDIAFSPTDGWAEARGVAIDVDGNVIAVGRGDLNGDGTATWAILKFDGATGAELWRTGSNYAGSARGVAVDHAGNVVVGGEGSIVKFDGVTGAELWAAGSGAYSTVVVDESDNIFTADLYSSFQVMKVARDGTIAWNQSLPGNDSGAARLVLDAAGNVIAVGTVGNGSVNLNIGTVKFDGATGAVLWESVIDSGFGVYDDGGLAIALDASGNPVVAGYFGSATRPEFALFNLDATTGAELWRYLLDGAGTDPVSDQAANAVAVDPSGNIIAGGQINPVDGNYEDFTVVKLNPDGTDFVQLCGNGVLEGTETCDDGNTTSGDGCSATCQTEPGFLCQGEPSTCVATIGVVPKKLLVLDKLAASGSAKTVFAAKDKTVSKGVGTDATAISATFTAAYANGAARGGFTVPAGAGWLVNSAKVAKYVNKTAPAGPTQTKVALIRPGSALSLTAKGIGDTPFDILTAGDPAGDVNTAYCVTNGGQTFCHCSVNQNCVFTKVAGDTGAKLKCKGGVADPTCAALMP